MKRILIAVAALLFSAATFAQANSVPPGGHRTPMTPEQKAKRETDNINSLTPLGDAYQKVLDVNKQDAAKMESITNGAKRNELTDDQKSQLKTLRETHKANLKTAMGATLYTKYEAARKAQTEQRKSDGGGHPHGE